MTETSWPFATSQLATETQWSRMLRNALLDGVIADDQSSTACKCTASGMTVSKAVGDADVNGFHYADDAVKDFIIPANGGPSTRYDRIVLRCSQTTNSVVATKLAGGTSPPALSADRDDVFDVPLCKVEIQSGATSVIVTDERWLKGNPVDVGSSAMRRDPRSGLLRVEDAATGNPKLLVGTGAAWKSLYPGDKWVKSSTTGALVFNTFNSWQGFSGGWSNISVPGVQAGDQLQIYLFVSLKVNTGDMGISFSVSGVGIGASDYSHEILNKEPNGFTYSQSLTMIYDAASSGTAVVTPRARSAGANEIVRGTLAAKIVR